jgi:hypothetical protein
MTKIIRAEYAEAIKDLEIVEKEYSKDKRNGAKRQTYLYAYAQEKKLSDLCAKLEIELYNDDLELITENDEEEQIMENLNKRELELLYAACMKYGNDIVKVVRDFPNADKEIYNALAEKASESYKLAGKIKELMKDMEEYA